MDAVEEVKARLSIEDVIAEYVELKRAGRNYKGLSPFAAEKTPSFVVSPEKQIWHDFSSGKGGDMFSFVMEMEGLDFKQTLELLARKAGVDLELIRGRGAAPGAAKHKERLYAASELAAKFYQVQFSKSKIALEYALGKRAFSKETALEWQLGYSPNTGSALCDFMVSKGFSPKEISEAGLSSASRYGSGLRDMFRGRLMIPLHDPQGRVIGFTARQLTDDKNAPKYINTPQTALYDKSRHVFGLHLAKESIRKEKYVVLVEGNLDVISSHQAGVRQVVATAGTAMTEFHLKALSKFTGDIRLSFDQDKAGLNATERAIAIASKVGVSLSMITIPSGKDPDELVKQDPELWRSVITENQYALDWLIDRYRSLLDLASAPGKREFSDVLLPVVRGLGDSVEQDHYLKQISDIIGVSQDALTDKYEQTTTELPKPTRKIVTPPPTDRQATTLRRAQNWLLMFALRRAVLRVLLVHLTPDMLIDEPARELLEFLIAHPGFDGTDKTELELLRPIANYVKMLSVAYEEGQYEETPDIDLARGAHKQLVTIVSHYVDTQQQTIKQQAEAASEAEKRDLDARDYALSQLIAKVQAEPLPGI